MTPKRFWLRMVLLFASFTYMALGIVCIVAFEPVPMVVNWPFIGWLLVISGVLHMWSFLVLEKEV